MNEGLAAAEVRSLSPWEGGSARLHPSKSSARLAQTKPARDDAAQHLGGAALNGEFWRDLHRERQYRVKNFVIAGIGLDEGGEIAHPLRQLLFPDGADVLDDR